VSTRHLWVKVHQYTGLGTAVFLVVIGLTGAILAFESDYDRWLNPSLWRVDPSASRGQRPHVTSPHGEQALVALVEQQFGAAGSNRVAKIDLGSANAAQVFEMANGLRVYVDPYSGRVTGTRNGPTALENFLWDVRVLHTRLFAGERGRLVVDAVSGLVVVLLVPVGLYLWWHKRRATVAWSTSWKRINWDVHSAVGIYAASVFLILAASGVFLGYEAPLYWLTRSIPQESPRLPRSTIPADSSHSVHADLDSVLAAADSALPHARTYQILLPQGPRSLIQVLKRSVTIGRNTVAFDQYSGRLLLVDAFSRDPRALRAHVIDQGVHMGTIGGLATKLLATLAGLALVVSVTTGTLIWWRRFRMRPMMDHVGRDKA
jgi:uncharacterized iron-regulated membrane protein